MVSDVGTVVGSGIPAEVMAKLYSLVKCGLTLDEERTSWEQGEVECSEGTPK